MFGAVSTVALVGLLSVLVPIVIHLINPGKGKVVWVGNIDLLKQAKKHRIKEYRIEQWPLLLLRILIFVVLTLILAKVYFNDAITGFAQHHSVVSEGWRASAADDVTPDYVVQDKHIWQQLAVLDQALPKGDTLDVYVTDDFYAFDSPTKPAIGREIKWHVKPSASGQETMTNTQHISVTVYANEPNKQIENALNAIKAVRLVNLDIRWKHPDGQALQSSDWLIYGQAGPVPEQILKLAAKGAILLVPGESHAVKPWGDGVIVSFELESRPDFANQLLASLTSSKNVAERFKGGRLSEREIALSVSDKLSEQLKTPLEDLLLALLVLLFLVERYYCEVMRIDKKVVGVVDA